MIFGSYFPRFGSFSWYATTRHNSTHALHAPHHNTLNPQFMYTHPNNRAFTTLFCLWNGDAIMETADQLGAVGHSRVFAMAYIVVFVFVFVYVVLNILLVVVQQVSR